MDRWLVVLVVVLAVWDLFWKGLALWRAARENREWWFIALLCINSAGVLPIIYLIRYSRANSKKSALAPKRVL